MQRRFTAIMLTVTVLALVTTAASLSAAESEFDVCQSITIGDDKNDVVSELKRNGVNFKSESLEYLYEPGNKQRGKGLFDAFFMASYPKELIYGSFPSTEERDRIFYIGISPGDIVGLVSCSAMASS